MESTTQRIAPYATAEEAAAYLKVTVQNLQKRGLLQTTLIGRRRFFTWKSLEKLANGGGR